MKEQFSGPSAAGGSLAEPRARPDGFKSPCAACPVRPLSICSGLELEELSELERIVQKLNVGPGDPIFDEAEPARHRFNVTAGCVKIYKLLGDGRRQIIGFLFSGDFLGLALEGDYAYSAEAVSRAELCRFPARELERLLRKHPALEEKLLGATANELAIAQDQMLLLGRKSAKEKVASMFLMLARRARARKLPDNPIAMPMTRADIGDYLGLTTETVSRTFTQFKTTGVIALEAGNRVRLKDIEALEELAEGF